MASKAHFKNAAEELAYYKECLSRSNAENAKLREMSHISSQQPTTLADVVRVPADSQDLDEPYNGYANDAASIDMGNLGRSPYNSGVSNVSNRPANVDLGHVPVELVNSRIVVQNPANEIVVSEQVALEPVKKEKAMAYLKRVYPKSFRNMDQRLKSELEKVLHAPIDYFTP